MKKILTLIFALIATALLLISCQDLLPEENTPLAGELILDMTLYGAGDTISGQISLDRNDFSGVTAAAQLNDEDLPLTIDGNGNFSFSLSPKQTTSYTLKITLTKGDETLTLSKDFQVSALPLAGSIYFDKLVYERGDPISGSLSLTNYDISEVFITWYLNGEETNITLNDEGLFSLALSPSETTNYTLEAVILRNPDDSDSERISANFQVEVPPVLSGTLVLNQNSFDYGETIRGTLSISNYDLSEISVDVLLNEEDFPLTIGSDGTFSFTLTPEVTTDYEIKVTLTCDGQTVVLDHDFIVKQIPFLGTWRANDEYTPAHPEAVDVVGIWYTDGFELYYIDSSAGTDVLLSYSARGTMGFPEENTWMTLTQTYYYFEDDSQWHSGTPMTPGVPDSFYAKYEYTDGVVEMSVYLDMTDPADAAEYTWEFAKLDDTIDPWF